jgi:hypothetical protein
MLGAAALVLAVACGRTTDPRPDGHARDTAGADDVGRAELATDLVQGEAGGSPDQGSRMCTPECLREVTCCRGDCAGPVVYRGCCSCLPGEVDMLSCPPQRQCQP